MKSKPKMKASLIGFMASAILWCLSLIGLLVSAIVWVLVDWETAWPYGLAALLLLVCLPFIYSLCYKVMKTTRKIIQDEQSRIASNMSSLRKRV